MIEYTFDFSVLTQHWQDLLLGAWLTLRITMISIVIGLAIAVVAAYQLCLGTRGARGFWTAYIEFVRNTPLLAQLFFVFFGLPSIGLRLDANTAAIIALAFNFTAYAADILRSGVEGVAKGQREAGLALALSNRQIFQRIMLIPAIALVYPALASQCVLVLLGGAVISTISANDLSSTAAVLQSITFKPFEVYLGVAAIYVVMALSMQTALDGVGRFAFTWTRKGR